MITILFWTIVGLFIGWNVPQPSFAKKLQEKFITPTVTWVKTKLKI